MKSSDLLKQQTALRWQGTVLSTYYSIDPSLSCIVSNYNIICWSVMDLSQILLSCLHALLHSLSLCAHISPVMIRNHCQISRIWQQTPRILPIVGSLVGQRGRLWIKINPHCVDVFVEIQKLTSHRIIVDVCSPMQSQTAVAAYFPSKQLLLPAFARQWVPFQCRQRYSNTFEVLLAAEIFNGKGQN